MNILKGELSSVLVLNQYLTKESCERLRDYMAEYEAEIAELKENVKSLEINDRVLKRVLDETMDSNCKWRDDVEKLEAEIAELEENRVTALNNYEREIAELKEQLKISTEANWIMTHKDKAAAIREMVKHLPQPRYWHNYEVIKVINEYADEVEGKGE